MFWLFTSRLFRNKVKGRKDSRRDRTRCFSISMFSKRCKGSLLHTADIASKNQSRIRDVSPPPLWMDKIANIHICSLNFERDFYLYCCKFSASTRRIWPSLKELMPWFWNWQRTAWDWWKEKVKLLTMNTQCGKISILGSIYSKYKMLKWFGTTAVCGHWYQLSTCGRWRKAA